MRDIRLDNTNADTHMQVMQRQINDAVQTDADNTDVDKTDSDDTFRCS